ATKSGFPKVMPKSANPSAACFQRIIPKALSCNTSTTRLSPRRAAVSSSWEFIMNPPSPHTARTRRVGWSIAAIMAEGRPADIAHELRIREKHLLDRRGKIAHMENLRSVRTHQERRLLHRVVADGDDQIGPVDRAMNIISL